MLLRSGRSSSSSSPSVEEKRALPSRSRLLGRGKSAHGHMTVSSSCSHFPFNSAQLILCLEKLSSQVLVFYHAKGRGQLEAPTGLTYIPGSARDCMRSNRVFSKAMRSSFARAISAAVLILPEGEEPSISGKLR